MILDGRASERGAAIIETALTIGLLFLVLFGVLEVGRFMQTQEILTNAAREGARLAVTPLPGSTTLPTTGEVIARVNEFTDAASITGTTVTVNPRTVTYGTINSRLTEVSVTLPYSLVTGIPWFSALGVTLTGQGVISESGV